MFNTTAHALKLKLILKDGYLKSFSLLKKPSKFNVGSCLYNENKFVYFSCTDKVIC